MKTIFENRLIVLKNRLSKIHKIYINESDYFQDENAARFSYLEGITEGEIKAIKFIIHNL